jgi:hypothetical protein
MPITSERQNIQDFRAAGFSEAQAVLLAEKLESTAKAVGDDLKGSIFAELDRRFTTLNADMDRRFAALTADMDRRFAAVDTRFAAMEARFERSLRLQLATILTAFLGVTGMAVALIKLLP